MDCGVFRNGFARVIQPGSEDAIENLARYIIRASFSQERMAYIPEESKVVYRSKDGKAEKVLDALDWLAAMCSHVPDKGRQMVRYVGFYSNVARGKRKMNDEDEIIPSILKRFSGVIFRIEAGVRFPGSLTATEEMKERSLTLEMGDAKKSHSHTA